MVEGKSPFERDTYRYSPLLALVLTPNIVLHRCWGKVLFAAADLLVGHLISQVLKLRGVAGNVQVVCAALWFFNPCTFAVATRGNSEALGGWCRLRFGMEWWFIFATIPSYTPSRSFFFLMKTILPWPPEFQDRS